MATPVTVEAFGVRGAIRPGAVYRLDLQRFSFMYIGTCSSVGSRSAFTLLSFYTVGF